MNIWVSETPVHLFVLWFDIHHFSLFEMFSKSLFKGYQCFLYEIWKQNDNNVLFLAFKISNMIFFRLKSSQKVF